MEFLVRDPAGFVFKPHAHKAKGHFILLAGSGEIETGDVKSTTGPTGFAYFPKGQTHNVTRTSSGPCTWYLIMGWQTLIPDSAGNIFLIQTRCRSQRLSIRSRNRNPAGSRSLAA